MTVMYANEPIKLLNASYEVLSPSIPLNKAARLLSKGKAVVEESVPGRFLRDWAWPKVLRLTYYVKLDHKALNGPPKVSKRYILLRDKRKCAYCGKDATTIDHIMPRSRGGKNTWQNLVAACTTCNHKKANRTPDEAGMRLLIKPYMPNRYELNPC